MNPELIFQILKSLVSIVPDIWKIYEDVKNKKPLAPELEVLLKDLEMVVGNFILKNNK